MSGPASVKIHLVIGGAKAKDGDKLLWAAQALKKKIEDEFEPDNLGFPIRTSLVFEFIHTIED